MKDLRQKRAAEKRVRESQYRKRAETASGKAYRLSQQINRVVLARLFSFTLSALFAWWTLKNGPAVMWGAAILFFFLFLLLIRYHQTLLVNRKILREIIRLNENEILSLRGDSSGFDDGREYLDASHPYSPDLDLFGEGAVFPFINRTTTMSGKENLAKRLLTTETKTEEILQTQEAVRELAAKPDWRQLFFATGKVIEEEADDEKRLRNILKSKPVFGSFGRIRFLSFLVPAGMFLLLILYAMHIIPYQPVLLYLLIPALIAGIPLKRINRYHARLSEGIRLLKKYERLLVLIENEDYQSRKLQEMKMRLGTGKLSAGILIRKLLRSFELLDARRNIFAGLFLNLLLLWDMHSLWAIRRWKKHYARKVDEWFTVLAETDALNSLASFAFTYPGYAWPEPGIPGELIRAVALGHPLIDPEVRVENDFILEDQGRFYILTGPNMAGKSTFLRAVGVNIVLAHCGAPVCASDFSFSPHKLYTSMRTTDSLMNQTSYFYAELQRLREIMKYLEKQNPVVILLDEILKGTNSKDKTSGSKAVIRKMISLEGAGIIATHDLSLGALEKEYPGHITNFCFEAIREDHHLTYDFLLRRGITKNMNATFLMEEMGIIDPE